MDMRHEILISENIEKVYNALTNASGLKLWWTSRTEFNSNEKVYKFSFMGGKYWFSFKITNQTKDKIEWECTNADSLSKDWIGTKLIFNLEKSEDNTIVRFAHTNRSENSEIFPRCNTTWGFLMFSLKNYLEKGKGSPIS